MFVIRTLKQREISGNAADRADYRSTVKTLEEICRNINETIVTENGKPLMDRLNYLSNEKAKIDAALSIIRAVSYGLSVKLDETTGFYTYTLKPADKRGVNRHYETLCARVKAGNTGLLNNTLHDELKSQRVVKETKFDADKATTRYIKAMRDSGLTDVQIVDFLKGALAKMTTNGKPIMDTPSHPATVRLFNNTENKVDPNHYQLRNVA